MEDKAPIIKPEGMTIAKAWLLFLLLLVVYFVSGIVAGYMMANENKVDITQTMALVTLVGVIIISALALFINKWELPRFNGLNSRNLFYGITLGLIIRYISSIIEEIPLGLLDMELLHEFAELDYLLIILPSIGLIFLQIGVIGHGLFKNYSLGIALSTTCLISLINFEPKTVLAMFILIGILTFFYYRTGSFEIVILGTLVYFLTDLLLLKFIDFDVMVENNYRYVILGNDVSYFGVMVVCVLLLLFLIRQVGQLKPIQWKQKTELIEY